MGDTIRFGYDFWDTQKERIVQMYVAEQKSAPEISKIYCCDSSTIIRNLRRFGVKIRSYKTGERYNAKYKIDTHYFDNIDSPEKAYILGFIAADGHISKQGTLMFIVQESDIDILRKILKELKSTHPINSKKSDGRNYYCVQIGSRPMRDRLNEIGVLHDKTISLKVKEILNFIPKRFEIDFIRGLFDGDGSVKIYKYPYFKKHSCHFGLTGVIETVEYIHEYFNLGTKIVDEGNGFYTCVSANRKKVVDACSAMYDNASIYLDRKYNTYKNLRQIYQTEK